MTDPNPSDKILEIRIGHRNAGFFAYVQYALNQIRYCERHNLLPVINYDESYGNYFVNPERGPNMWDYYFHPPCRLTWSDVQSRLDDPHDALTRNEVTTLNDDEIRELCQNNPQSIFHYTYGYWRRNPPQDLDQWYEEQRKEGQAYVARYVKVRKEYLDRVDAILDAHVDGQFLVGAHIRATDMLYAPTVPLESYIQHLDGMLEEHEEARIFIATDQQQYIEILGKRYGDRLFSQDCLRSHNATNAQKLKRNDKSKLGEEVLVDALLLSKCDFLLKCPSAVGEFAHYFNPGLESLDLSFHQANLNGYDFSADYRKRRNYPRGWELMSGKYTKLNWRLKLKHLITRIPLVRTRH